MKSPADLRLTLRKQWENANHRENRLRFLPGSWPIVVSIGRPSSRRIRDDLDGVKRHVEAWRRVEIGHVETETITYRVTKEPVEIPVRWILRKPSEWLSACADSKMNSEFQAMERLVSDTDSLFHSFWLRRRGAWRDKPLEEVILAGKLAMQLEPNFANGRPLRSISILGIDTKFFERNARLITQLLDVRYDGEVSRLGLEVFLGALLEGDHWLLVVDLDGSLLSFRKQRVRSSELAEVQLKCSRLLVVENECCQHLLPSIPGCIAVLGSGFDLQWMQADWLEEIKVAYWGDIDTWGLQFLAQARRYRPNLTSLLMNEETLDLHKESCVKEPIIAGTAIPTDLLEKEQHLYSRLIHEPKGRLEQEYLRKEQVIEAIKSWE